MSSLPFPSTPPSFLPAGTVPDPAELMGLVPSPAPLSPPSLPSAFWETETTFPIPPESYPQEPCQRCAKHGTRCEFNDSGILECGRCNSDRFAGQSHDHACLARNPDTGRWSVRVRFRPRTEETSFLAHPELESCRGCLEKWFEGCDADRQLRIKCTTCDVAAKPCFVGGSEEEMFARPYDLHCQLGMRVGCVPCQEKGVKCTWVDRAFSFEGKCGNCKKGADCYVDDERPEDWALVTIQGWSIQQGSPGSTWREGIGQRGQEQPQGQSSWARGSQRGGQGQGQEVELPMPSLPTPRLPTPQSPKPQTRMPEIPQQQPPPQQQGYKPSSRNNNPPLNPIHHIQLALPTPAPPPPPHPQLKQQSHEPEPPPPALRPRPRGRPPSTASTFPSTPPAKSSKPKPWTSQRPARGGKRFDFEPLAANHAATQPLAKGRLACHFCYHAARACQGTASSADKACVPCSKLGLQCVDRATRTIYPHWNALASAGGKMYELDNFRCGACVRAGGGNCDHKRPCERCVRSGERCDGWAFKEGTWPADRFHGDRGANYYMAMGYGAAGVGSERTHEDLQPGMLLIGPVAYKERRYGRVAHLEQSAVMARRLEELEETLRREHPNEYQPPGSGWFPPSLVPVNLVNDPTEPAGHKADPYERQVWMRGMTMQQFGEGFMRDDGSKYKDSLESNANIGRRQGGINIQAMAPPPAPLLQQGPQAVPEMREGVDFLEFSDFPDLGRPSSG